MSIILQVIFVAGINWKKVIHRLSGVHKKGRIYTQPVKKIKVYLVEFRQKE